MTDAQSDPQAAAEADAPENTDGTIVPIGAEKQLSQLREVFEFACQQHGEDSETAQLLKVRIDEVITERAKIAAQLSGKRAIPPSIALNAEKGAVLYVAVGGVLLLALVGTSTMFLGMLTLKLFNT